MLDPAIRFEIVTVVDPDTLIQLYREAGWWQDSMESRKRLPDLVRNSFCFVVALHQEKIIGMGRVISDGVSDAYIHDVIVRKTYRGQAIGAEIIRRLTQYCLDQRLEWIGLIATPEAVGMYKRLGFRILEGHASMVLEQELK